MASRLNRVLGGLVTHTPKGGAPNDVAAIFRDTPIEVLDSDGHAILTISTSLSAQGSIAADIAVNDKITVPDGRVFEIVNSMPSGSPAIDAFTVFELEEI